MDIKRRTTIHNEKLKLTSSYINAVAIGLLIFGIVRPIFEGKFVTLAQFLAMIIAMVVSIVVHIIGRRLLNAMQSEDDPERED
ncbi:MAG: hypothetical protein MRY63_08700 [Neomegalonema sp.]|nr:hypothetical protein [Neomegalonema sp.]